MNPTTMKVTQLISARNSGIAIREVAGNWTNGIDLPDVDEEDPEEEGRQERRPFLAVLRAHHLDRDLLLDQLVARSRRRSASPSVPAPGAATRAGRT